MAARLTAVDQRVVALVFAIAVGAYLPTARYGFVEDDRAVVPFEPVALRAQCLLWLRRGERARAVALADTAVGRDRTEADWYRAQLADGPKR